MLNERKLTKSELAKREDIIMNMKKNKRALVKKYGKDAEAVMYGRATNQAKKQSENMEHPNNKVREMIKDSLKNPKSADLNKDGKLSDYEEKRGAAIEKNLNEDNIGLADIEEMGYEAGEAAFEKIKGKFKNKPDHQAYRKGFFQGFTDNASSYGLNEDLDLGHEDNEPHMLKADLYRIGKYAMELYQMVDQFEGEGEVDFPHWWQSKISNAKSAIVGAKHYLDFEIKEPQIDAMVDVAQDVEAIDEEAPGKADMVASSIQKAMNKHKGDESKTYQLQQARKAMNKGDLDKAEKIAKRLAEKLKGDKKQLDEYTDNDFSGEKLITNTPAISGDKLAAFDDFFPNGVASRGNAVASLQSHDKSGIKARMGRYAPMFVHVQYHDFQDVAGEKYRVHQKQFYNSNFKDKDPNFNPSVTKLSLTKLADPSNPSPQSQKDIDLGSILVKTDEYIKDLKDLDITNRQS